MQAIRASFALPDRCASRPARTGDNAKYLRVVQDAYAQARLHTILGRRVNCAQRILSTDFGLEVDVTVAAMDTGEERATSHASAPAMEHVHDSMVNAHVMHR